MQTLRGCTYSHTCENVFSSRNECLFCFEFMKEENQLEYIADHQAGNDAWSLPRTCRANYGGNRFLRFSGISKKQFSDFSWRSAVEENWRTSGQSAVFHAAATTQRNSFEYFLYLRTTRIDVNSFTSICSTILWASPRILKSKILLMLVFYFRKTIYHTFNLV